MGFMVLFSTSLHSRFQRKNPVWKKNESWDIVQNILKFGSLAQKAIFWYLFTDISGLSASFWKLIDSLKSWVQIGRKEYQKPHKLNAFFSYP